MESERGDLAVLDPRNRRLVDERQLFELALSQHGFIAPASEVGTDLDQHFLVDAVDFGYGKWHRRK
jgi:hypothetical protein